MMRELFIVVPSFISLALSAVALWLAYRALHKAEQASRAARRPQRTPPAVRPLSQPRESRERERPWRESPPQDAPEWLRESFSKCYDLIQELQGEVVRLKAEFQRFSRSDTRYAPTHSAPAGASQKSPTRGQAVDLRDGMIVPSRALAAPGVLVIGSADEQALLYLNEDIELDHIARDRWSQYFDFDDGDPYRRYRTVEPSRIEWNASAEQGRLLSRGKAEVV